MKAIVSSKNEERKQHAVNSYNTACMIVDFLGRSMAKKELPRFEEVIQDNSKAKASMAFTVDR